MAGLARRRAARAVAATTAAATAAVAVAVLLAPLPRAAAQGAAPPPGLWSYAVSLVGGDVQVRACVLFASLCSGCEGEGRRVSSGGKRGGGVSDFRG